MNALKQISNVLAAMGANPAPVSDNELKINAPQIAPLEKSGETCENITAKDAKQ